jgi:class 3 adenylate cyclase
MSNSLIPARYLKPHYSTKFCKAYFNYLRDHFNADLFESVCESLQVPSSFLLNDSNWVSHEFYQDFLGTLKRVTGDEKLAYHVGQTMVRETNVNPFEFALAQLMWPQLFFWLTTFSGKKINRISTYRIVRNRFGLAEIELRSSGPIHHDEDICQNAKGFFESLKHLWTLDRIAVEHPECIHRGQSRCLFAIRYSARRLWIKRCLYLASGSLAFWGISRLTQFIRPDDPVFQFLAQILTLSTFGWAMLVKKASRVFKHQTVVLDQSHHKDTEIYSNRVKLNFRKNESVLLKDLALKLNRAISPNDMIHSCLEELVKVFEYQRCIMMQFNKAESYLHVQEALGFDQVSGESSVYQLKIQYPAADPENANLFANILSTGTVRSIFNIAEFKKPLKPKNQKLLDMLQVNSLVVAPVQDKDEKFGLLIVGAIGSDQTLTPEDAELIEKTAQLFSISFRNTMNLEKEKNLRNLFQKYVPAMVTEQFDDQGRSFEPTHTELTSIFVDLRGFTSVCEVLRPDQVRTLLTLYTDFVTNILAHHGAIIDKLVGDGINAFFMPNPKTPNHRASAFLAAAQMLAELGVFRNECERRGLPEPCIGIGVHSGSALVGAMGGEHKLDFTAIGDTINTASRLQELTKKYISERLQSRDGILAISTETLDQSGFNTSPDTQESVLIRGKSAELQTSVFGGKSLSVWFVETQKSSLKKAA